MSNYDTHNPDNTPEDNGWDGKYRDECDECEPRCEGCPIFSPDDQELMDRLFQGMTQEEICEWMTKEIGDDEIPF